MTVVAQILSKLIKQKKTQAAGYVIVLFILTSFTIRTIIRNFDWRNQDTLWVATDIYSPSSYFNHNNLGDMYMRQGDYVTSEKEFLKAIRLNPYYAEAYHNLGNLYKQAGYNDKAIAAFKKSISIKWVYLAICAKYRSNIF
jgi:tetratricopeptide (TPR) repeat protein